MRRSLQGSIAAAMAAFAISTAPVAAGDPGWDDPSPAPGEPTSQERPPLIINYHTGGEHHPSDDLSSWSLLAAGLAGGTVFVAWQRRRKSPSATG